MAIVKTQPKVQQSVPDRVQQGASKSKNDVPVYESCIDQGKNAHLLNFTPKSCFKMASNAKSLNSLENGGTASKADVRTPPYFRKS